MMQSSITAIEGVLQPQQSTATAVPTVLDVRQPDQVFTGFFINAQGAVLTTHDVTQNCTTIRIADMHPVDLAYSDETAGFAVLQPQDTLSPIRFAEISAQPPAISTSTMIAGFPFNGTLGSASTIMGEASREQGGQGQANLLRLDIETRPGESGGPVIAQSGAVIGMILPQDHNGRTLPANVTLAQSMATIADALQNADITLTQSDEAAMLSQRNMARLASEITVPLACYN
jgi:S1-C subfamily serine protease